MSKLLWKSIWVLLLCGVLSSVSFSKDILWKDGLWNGKPTPVDILKEGVAKGNAEALAEWADCSRNGINDIKYNLKDTVKYATLAHEKGSVYGTAVLARCYLIGEGVAVDEKLGAELAAKAAKEGNPTGMKELAHVYREGLGGYPIDLVKHAELLNKSADLGYMMARLNRTYYLIMGTHGFPKDLRKSYNELAELVDIYPYAIISNNYIQMMIKSGKKDEAFSEERYERSYAFLKASAKLGNETLKAWLGYALIRDGKPELGVSYILNAVQTPDKVSSMLVFDLVNSASFRGKAKSAGEYKTRSRLARDAYQAGNRHKVVLAAVAEAYISGIIDAGPSFDKSWPIVEELLKTDCYKAGTIAGSHFNSEQNPKHDIEIARAYYILSIFNKNDLCDCTRFLSQTYWNIKEGDDLAKGYAASHYALKFQDEVFRKTVEAVLERIMKKITKEEIIRGKLLVKKNYPFNNETVEAARKLLESHQLPIRIEK